MAKRWPAVRASLIALAIIVGLADGCPVPPRDRVGGFAPVVDGVNTARRAVLFPFGRAAALFDVHQRWSLFRGAAKRRFRLVVEGHTATDQWEAVYRAGDDGPYGPILEYRRMRGSYSPSGQRPRGAYPSFAQWMAARALADHPEIDRVRVSLERVVIGPRGGWTPTGELTLTQERRRERAKEPR